jgi:nitrite reductase/ring-hydroxylating ferredoxin subunit
VAADPQDVGYETLSDDPNALCRLEDIPDGEGMGFTIPGGAAELDIFVIRQGDRVFGYINSCPHSWTPLDWNPDQFTNMDKTHIVCATHGAVFEIEDGKCTSGPCKGDRLKPYRVIVADGMVRSEK